MYISSYLSLDTALSGVEAAQEEMDTTGQNISNVNTPGYEEQVVDLSESASLSIAGSGADGAMQLGTGVNASGIANSADPYLDASWRQTNASASAATTTQTYLTQIQNALGSTSSGSGINTELAAFWSDWNKLSDNPTSAAAQEAVVSDGQTLSQSFNSLSQQLNGSDPLNPGNPANASSVLGQVNNEYQDAMAGPTAGATSGGTVYNAAFQIASLNREIVQEQGSGQSANALIDQRNSAIDSLSALGNVQVHNNTDGSVTVYFGGVSGTALVSDPAGSTAGTAVPAGDNFGTYATSGGAAATGWVAAFQHQYAAAGAAGTTAAQLASTVGGQLGALIGLAGYSYTAASGSAAASGSFGNIGAPETDSSGETAYPNPVSATVLGTIGTVSASLDTVATSLMNEANNPGVDYSGTPIETASGSSPVSATGTTGAVSLLANFFVLNSSSSSSSAAAKISVSSSLLAASAAGITPGKFGASTTTATDNGTSNIQVSTLYTTYSGNYSSDNDVALDEANNSGGSADSAYASFVQQVGSLVQGANDTQSTQAALQTQVTNQRQSAEGVDLSQEMANLITEQQSYQASAKVMDAFSTMMNSLMSVVGQ